MKILITHFYSQQNRGDAAILEVQLRELKKVFPTSSILISTLESPEKIKEFSGFKCISSFFYLSIYRFRNPIIKAGNTMYILFSTFVWVNLFKAFSIDLKFILSSEVKKVINEYHRADLVIPVGGGYLTAKDSMRSTISLILQLHSLYMAKRLGKHVFLYSQSIGPFGNTFQYKLSSIVLRRMDFIIVREEFSYDVLRKMGLDPKKYTQSVDAGFLFKANTKRLMKKYLRGIGVDSRKLLVGITVKRWFDHEKQDRYEDIMISLIQKLISKGNIQILLIPQVTSLIHNDDDSTINKRIFRKLKKNRDVFLINRNLDHKNIKGVYSDLDYLIGTRMHSCIFSLTSEVPVLAIEYEYKTRGMMKDLGLEKWIIKIDEISPEKLEIKYEQLRKRRKEYIQILRSNLNNYVNQAKEAKFKLKQEFLNYK